MDAITSIGIVGPCAAGKTTLADRLRTLGYNVHHIAQEHSFVPDMWARIVSPSILIYLDVTFEESLARRPTDMTAKEFEFQRDRLEHARQHADLYIQTTGLTPEEILDQVIAHLEDANIQPQI